MLSDKHRNFQFENIKSHFVTAYWYTRCKINITFSISFAFKYTFVLRGIVLLIVLRCLVATCIITQPYNKGFFFA